MDTTIKSIALGLVVGVLGTLALVFFTGHLSSGGVAGDQNFGAAGVPNRFPHGYIDTGYGYYVNGVAAIDSAGNGSFGTLTASGAATTGNLVQSGTASLITTSSATYTLTAADICTRSAIPFQPLNAITTVTLPASTTLFASCLGTTGQFKELSFASVSTSTVLAAGAGGTLFESASTTVSANKTAMLRIINVGNAYYAQLVNLNT